MRQVSFTLLTRGRRHGNPAQYERNRRFGPPVRALGREAGGARLPSGRLRLNASKSESRPASGDAAGVPPAGGPRQRTPPPRGKGRPPAPSPRARRPPGRSRGGGGPSPGGSRRRRSEGDARSLADDLGTDRGVVPSRAASSPRSAETKPSDPRDLPAADGRISAPPSRLGDGGPGRGGPHPRPVGGGARRSSEEGGRPETGTGTGGRRAEKETSRKRARPRGPPGPDGRGEAPGPPRHLPRRAERAFRLGATSGRRAPGRGKETGGRRGPGSVPGSPRKKRQVGSGRGREGRPGETGEGTARTRCPSFPGGRRSPSEEDGEASPQRSGRRAPGPRTREGDGREERPGRGAREPEEKKTSRKRARPRGPPRRDGRGDGPGAVPPLPRRAEKPFRRGANSGRRAPGRGKETGGEGEGERESEARSSGRAGGRRRPGPRPGILPGPASGCRRGARPPGAPPVRRRDVPGNPRAGSRRAARRRAARGSSPDPPPARRRDVRGSARDPPRRRKETAEEPARSGSGPAGAAARGGGASRDPPAAADGERASPVRRRGVPGEPPVGRPTRRGEESAQGGERRAESPLPRPRREAEKSPVSNESQHSQTEAEKSPRGRSPPASRRRGGRHGTSFQSGSAGPAAEGAPRPPDDGKGRGSRGGLLTGRARADADLVPALRLHPRGARRKRKNKRAAGVALRRPSLADSEEKTPWRTRDPPLVLSSPRSPAPPRPQGGGREKRQGASGIALPSPAEREKKLEIRKPRKTRGRAKEKRH